MMCLKQGFIFFMLMYCLSSCLSDNKNHGQIEKDNKLLSLDTISSFYPSETEGIDSSRIFFQAAIDLLRENSFFLTTENDTMVYLEAVNLMEKAIVLDVNNINVYNNLSRLYFKLGRFDEAIKTLDKLLLADSSYVQAIVSQGFIYEKTGSNQTAIEKYDYVLTYYNQNIVNDFNVDINRLFLMLLLDEIENVSLELERIKRQYPEQNIDFFELQFQNFDRKKFIDNSLR